LSHHFGLLIINICFLSLLFLFLFLWYHIILLILSVRVCSDISWLCSTISIYFLSLLRRRIRPNTVIFSFLFYIISPHSWIHFVIISTRYDAGSFNLIALLCIFPLILNFRKANLFFTEISFLLWLRYLTINWLILIVLFFFTIQKSITEIIVINLRLKGTYSLRSIIGKGVLLSNICSTLSWLSLNLVVNKCHV
jgi:hypothetical protein